MEIEMACCERLRAYLHIRVGVIAFDCWQHLARNRKCYRALMPALPDSDGISQLLSKSAPPTLEH